MRILKKLSAFRLSHFTINFVFTSDMDNLEKRFGNRKMVPFGNIQFEMKVESLLQISIFKNRLLANHQFLNKAKSGQCCGKNQQLVTRNRYVLGQSDCLSTICIYRQMTPTSKK